MSKLKIGFVGCGEIAVASARAVSEAQNIEIGMVMDINEQVAKDLSEKHRVPYTTKLDEILSNGKIDAVYTPTPHYLHAPIAIQAARAGKHVLVEKPIATSLADAKAMIKECKKNGVALSVAFVSRYESSTIKTKELIDKGVFGKIIATEIRNLTSKPWSYWDGGFTGRVKSDWRRYKEKSGGGILIMNVVHNIDRMRYVTGLEAERVYSEYGSFNSPPGVEVEDLIAVLVRYTNGAVGWIEAGSSIEGSKSLEGTRMDVIYGTEGQILKSRGAGVRVYTTRKTEELTPNSWQEIHLKDEANPRTRLFDEFAAAVVSGEPVPITGDDGLKALEIIVGAYRSREEGKPIELPSAM